MCKENKRPECFGSFELCRDKNCKLVEKCMDATSESLYAEHEEYKQMLEDNE